LAHQRNQPAAQEAFTETVSSLPADWWVPLRHVTIFFFPWTEFMRKTSGCSEFSRHLIPMIPCPNRRIPAAIRSPTPPRQFPSCSRANGAVRPPNSLAGLPPSCGQPSSILTTTVSQRLSLPF
jgi:hypothetical protein